MKKIAYLLVTFVVLTTALILATGCKKSESQSQPVVVQPSPQPSVAPSATPVAAKGVWCNSHAAGFAPCGNISLLSKDCVLGSDSEGKGWADAWAIADVNSVSGGICERFVCKVSCQ